MDIETKVAFGLATLPEMEEMGADAVFKVKSDKNRKHKTFTAKAPLRGEDGKARLVLSEQTPDRIEDIVSLEGLDQTDFNNNPVMLSFHDKYELEGLIGAWEVPLSIEGNQLLGTPVFMDAGINPKADMASEMFDAGFLRGASISFIPSSTRKSTEQEQKDLGISRFSVVHEKSSLLEVSLVSLPMHPNTLRKMAMDTEHEIEYLQELQARVADDFPPTHITKQLEAIMSELLELRASVLDKSNGTSDSISESVEATRTDRNQFYAELFAQSKTLSRRRKANV